MAIKLADTLVPMADFPAVMAEHTEFADGESLQEKLDNGSLGGGGTSYTQLSQAEYDALTEDEKMNGKEYRTYDTGHIYKLGIEYGKDAYFTSLSQLGLTAPTTVGEIFVAMPDKSMLMLNCNAKSEHITDVPVDNGLLTIERWNNNRFRIEYNTSLGGSVSTNRKWIGTLKGTDGTGLTWNEVAYENNHRIKSYSSLADLGLDTTATLKDITRNMAKNSMIAIKVDAMADQSEYNNITQGTVTIHKVEDARVQAIMTEKSTGRTWIGTLGGENTIIGWKELRSDSPFHRIVTQGIAGYFKFKPTSTGTDQSLRISVTDNYGGMINISGATPSGSQYKPFKCIRLSNGTYADYDAIKTTNNKMEKLYFYDGYFYLKVVSYTTCTFAGLIEAPTYVETFDNTVAEEIPIRSVFDTPYNNGYADPSIICIGDTASSDGVIKTLSTLGFTEDVMTWDNGEYRVSHIGGLTNLPAEITEEKPGFRLEHHDVKKWGSNHNPHHSTYGCRQSILHYKGNIFVRYQESSATAGVITTDTGWQKLAKVYTTLAELGLTADATIENVIKTLPTGGKALISTHEFTNYQTLFPYSVEADKYATLKVEKGYDNNGSRTIVAWVRKDASRVVYGGLDATNAVKWWNEVSINGVGAKTLVSNAQNFKLDITKKNASFYGFFKLEYLYGYHLCEICIGISSALAYTVTKGKNLIDKITYTIDGANIVFGIDFTTKVYGVQVVEMPTDFGRINSLTAESFTGNTVMNQTGLDVELHKQVKVITSLDKGTWQVGQRIKQKTDFTASTADANFEFVAKNEGSSTNKQQKMTIYQLTPIENGTNASLSLIVYEDGRAQVTVWPATENMPRNDYNIVSEGYLNKKLNYSTSEVAIGTWIDGKTIYRKTFTKSPSSDQATGNQVTINVATISGLTNVIDIQATAKLYNYNNTSTPIYMKIPFTELWRSSSTSSASCAYSVYVEGTALKMRVNNCSPDDIYYITVEYTK